MKKVSAPTQKLPLLFQLGVDFFSTLLHDSGILKKPEIPISGRVAELQKYWHLTTFQQQGISAFQNRERSQNHKHHSRNRPMESRNQRTVSQTTQQVIHQSISHQRVLSKPMLTEFSGELFDVAAHQQRLSDTEKNAPSEDYLLWSCKSGIFWIG